MAGDILQPTHLLLILVVALIVLGPKRLPEVGRSLGRGLRDFRNALTTNDAPPAEELVTESRVSSVAGGTPQPASETRADSTLDVADAAVEEVPQPEQGPVPAPASHQAPGHTG